MYKKLSHTEMKVLVFTEPCANSNEFVVWWTLGGKRGGAYQVTVEHDIPDKNIAAELHVLRYLLDELSIFGAARAGNGIDIYCSFGAIKNLQKLKSDKKHLMEYALFLATRFADSKITVEKEPERWASYKERFIPEPVTVHGPKTTTLHLHGAGKVFLRLHALNQFSQRHNIDDKSKAWRMLSKLANDNNLRVVKLPDNVDHFKSAKYEKPAVIYYSPSSHWNFTVIEDDGENILVTAFYRPQNRSVLV